MTRLKVSHLHVGAAEADVPREWVIAAKDCEGERQPVEPQLQALDGSCGCGLPRGSRGWWRMPRGGCRLARDGGGARRIRPVAPRVEHNDDAQAREGRPPAHEGPEGGRAWEEAAAAAWEARSGRGAHAEGAQGRMAAARQRRSGTASG